MPKMMYKPLQLAISMAGALLAGAVFNQIWKRVGKSDEVPDPQDLGQSGREVLMAAALHGLIFGLVKAAIGRAGAHGYHAVTRESPD